VTPAANPSLTNQKPTPYQDCVMSVGRINIMKKKNKYPNFNLVENTTGVILNGVYVKDDFSEIIVSMAWGGDLHFKPESEIKPNEKRAEIRQ